jgi:hypothetical protein
MNVNESKKAPKGSGKSARRKPVKKKTKVSKLLQRAIEAFDERIKAKDFKPTIAEYLKLLQLEQESNLETPKEIKVTWIDPTVTSDSEK